MTTKADLAELLERVVAAQGPDREIDADIHWLIVTTPDQHRMKGDERHLQHEYFAGPDGPVFFALDQWFGPGATDYPYSASLDAALGLRDRLFATWFIFVGDLDPSDPRAVATLAQGYPDQPSYRGFAPCQRYALAVCAAILKALIAKEEASHPSVRAPLTSDGPQDTANKRQV